MGELGPASKPPPLHSGEVHVWRAELGRAAVAEVALTGLLSEEERARADRFRHAGDRRRFEVGRGLLRELLGVYAGLDPRAIPLLVGPHGKPTLAPDAASPNLDCNVSHSGDRVLVAVARGVRIGIDVERLDRNVDADGIAARFFAPPEVALLRGIPPARRIEVFLRLWVMKEAVAKGIGTGIGGLDMRQFAVSPEETSGPRIDPLTPATRTALAGWSLREIAVSPGYTAALAVLGAAQVHLGDWPR